jgi:hypothetical protein
MDHVRMKLKAKRYVPFVLCCVLAAVQVRVQAQEDRVLTGAIIYRDHANNREHPVAHAFDGDIHTYFMSYPPFGNWIGMDLREKHIITKVAFCPRIDSDYRDRLQLGIFEGANREDFSDAIPLFIIPGLTERRLTEQEIRCTRGFRYVRFVFPTEQISGKSSYMAELQFYGFAGEGDDSHLPQLTNLPTVSIKTDGNEDVVEKEKYLNGVITVVYNDGSAVFSEKTEIRGRGNASWGFPKKPYRIKLNNSTNLMGLPAKGRNWTLINNYGDKTCMRNILAFDYSRRLEMPYTSPAIAVDVVLNGDYKGCYQLCDQIDVRKNRVDIEEMKKEDLTGGYMLEIDAYAEGEPKMFYSNAYRIPVTIKYPDEEDLTPAQERYIVDYFEKFVTSVAASGGETRDEFLKYTDIESFLRHFLVGEYSGNTDTYWSVYMTKKRDEDPFRFGPVWDFDLAFENDSRTYPINERAKVSGQWLCLSNESSAAGGTKDVVRKIISNETADDRMKKIYAHYRKNNVISKEILLGVVDSCAQLLEISQDLNFKRWPIMNQLVHQNPVVHGSFAAEVENVKKFVSERIDWMDKKLSYDPMGNDPGEENDLSPKVWTAPQTIYLLLRQACEIYVHNLSGSLVKRESLGPGTHQIPVSGGFYILTAVPEQGGSVCYKCVVR